jgi:ABC-2 type transport system ATP-binding protein
VQILSTLIPANADELRVADHDVRSDPDGVRAAIGVTRQFSAVDDPQNLRLMADLEHLCRDAGRARVAVLLERSDLVGAARRRASA